MSNQLWLEERDAVLTAFVEACPTPTAAQVSAWKARHPEFAPDIVEFAATMLEFPPSEEPSDAAQQAAEDAASEATFATFLAKMRSGQAPETRRATLAELIARAGTDIPSLARTLGIGRVVLADAEAGRIRPNLGIRMLDALSSALAVSKSAIEDAVTASFLAPSAGHAMSDGAPQARARSFEEAVRDSGMPSDRQAYWLGED